MAEVRSTPAINQQEKTRSLCADGRLSMHSRLLGTFFLSREVAWRSIRRGSRPNEAGNSRGTATTGSRKGKCLLKDAHQPKQDWLVSEPVAKQWSERRSVGSCTESAWRCHGDRMAKLAWGSGTSLLSNKKWEKHCVRRVARVWGI